MGKGRRNQRNPDYYKVQGGAVEQKDAARAARQALADERARERAARARPKRKRPPVRVKAKARPSRPGVAEIARTIAAGEMPAPQSRSTQDSRGRASQNGRARALLRGARRMATFAFGVARTVIDRVRHRSRD